MLFGRHIKKGLNVYDTRDEKGDPCCIPIETLFTEVEEDCFHLLSCAKEGPYQLASNKYNKL